jgi:phage/plasmid-associated DNA primase
MSRNILDSAAGGAFTEKTIVESKDILESILQNYSQWHSERAPNPSKKVNSIEQNSDWSTKMDTILAYINKQTLKSPC